MKKCSPGTTCPGFGAITAERYTKCPHYLQKVNVVAFAELLKLSLREWLQHLIGSENDTESVSSYGARLVKRRSYHDMTLLEWASYRWKYVSNASGRPTIRLSSRISSQGRSLRPKLCRVVNLIPMPPIITPGRWEWELGYISTTTSRCQEGQRQIILFARNWYVYDRGLEDKPKGLEILCVGGGDK